MGLEALTVERFVVRGDGQITAYPSNRNASHCRRGAIGNAPIPVIQNVPLPALAGASSRINIMIFGARLMRRRTLCFAVLALAMSQAMAQTSPMTPDITGKKFEAPTAANDYVKREVMIPMRDGVKLHTVIVVPKGAHGAPILLTRTPYDADGRGRAPRTPPHISKDLLPQGDDVFVEGGYIRVFQDIRGKYGSKATTS